MFDFLKKKTNAVEEAQMAPRVQAEDGRIIIGAPIKGKAVPSSEIPDAVFAEEMLGKGMAIIPSEGKVYAPEDGEVTVMMDTMHAVNINTADGVDLLIHIGLDTVGLNGKHFTSHVKEGDKVKRGQLLIEFDIPAIQKEGLNTICPCIICNSNDYADIIRYTGMDVGLGDPIFELIKKTE